MWINKEGQIVEDNDQYISSNGTLYPFNYPKSEIDELRYVELTDMPKDESLSVTGFEVRDGKQFWLTTRKTDEEISMALSTQKSSYMTRIDNDVDDLYAAVVGNRLPEYTIAEDEATKFATSKYQGQVPQSVASWAAAKGMPAQWAADDIITKAKGLRTAQIAIRAKRLLAKERIRNAKTTADVFSIYDQWSNDFSSIRNLLLSDPA